MENRWRGSLQLLFGLGLAVLFFYMMAPFLVAILLGAVFAIISYPFFDSLQTKMPRSLAALSVTLGMVIGVMLPFSFVLIAGAYKLLGLISTLKLPKPTEPHQSLIDHPWVQQAVATLSRFSPISQEWLDEQATQVFHAILEKVSGLVGALLTGMPGLLLGFFVVVVSLFFFLGDGGKFLRFLASLSPMKAERSVELYRTFERSCRGVVLGLFISSLFQAALMTFFYLITGIPNAFLIGVVTVALAMVPLIGSAPASVGGVIYLFANGNVGMGIVMTVGAIMIAVSDNVVRPIVMRGSTEMHPLLALVSVFGAINLMGATGIFLGPIIAAVFVSFLKMLSQEIRKEKIETVVPSPT